MVDHNRMHGNLPLDKTSQNDASQKNDSLHGWILLHLIVMVIKQNSILKGDLPPNELLVRKVPEDSLLTRTSW